MQIVKDVYVWSYDWDKWLFSRTFNTLIEAEDWAKQFDNETAIAWRNNTVVKYPNFKGL